MAIIEAFERQKQSFILVWSGTERRATGYNGEIVTIPTKDEAFGPGHRFQSAKDKKGNLIPGTVVIEDENARNAEGEIVPVIQARIFLQNIQRNHARLFASGLVAVESIDDIPEARVKSAKLWERCQETADLRVLQEETQRLEEHRKHGSSAPPASPERAMEIRAAMERQSARNKIRTGQQRLLENDLRAVIDGQAVELGPPTIEEIMTPNLVVESPEELIEEAAAVGVEISEAELKALKAGDQKVMNLIAKRNEDAANAKLGDPPVPDVDTAPQMEARKRRGSAA